MQNERVEYAALVLRLGLGGVMLAHGLTKLFVYTLPGTAAFFESVGFPGFTAYPVTATEVVGGLLLLVGYQTRWAALAMVPVLLGAVSVHFANGWVFSVPGGGWEFPFVLAVFALGQFVLGTDGALALGSSRTVARTGAQVSTLAAESAAR